MEVDVLSPRMSGRTISKKRARSPTGSPCSRDRAVKRTIITHEPTSQHVWDGAVMMRKALSEDEWVHQTRGLTIRSPSLDVGERPPGADYLQCRYRASEGADVQMGMDVQSEPRSPHTPDRAMHESQLASETAQKSAQAHSFLHVPQSSRTAVPHIALHPPTPLGSASATTRERDPLSASLVLTPPASCTPSLSCSDESCSPVSMSVEPLPSSLPSLPSSPSWRAGQRKRPVISMGPRADCEKCRLKVPGHWMHFD